MILGAPWAPAVAKIAKMVPISQRRCLFFGNLEKLAAKVAFKALLGAILIDFV